MIKIRNIKFLNFIFILSFFATCFGYANPSATNQPENNSSIRSRIIRFHDSVAEKIDKAATSIDKRITPAPYNKKENKSRVYIITGADYYESDELDHIIRFGGQLHLPQFEQYWKLKFSNDDDRRFRGRNKLSNERGDNATEEDFFVGVNIERRLKDISLSYEPKIAIGNGIGLDHSFEAEIEIQSGPFAFEPGLELFANHNEGTGTSSKANFSFKLSKHLSLIQNNDSRYTFLNSLLSINHSIGFGIRASDRLSFTPQYFRGYENDYKLSSYGAQISSHYSLIPEILFVQITPYVLRERDKNFMEVLGVVVTFRMNFGS